MTQNEYREIVAFLRRNFPNAKKYQDRDTLNDGWLLMKDMDAQEITDAVLTYMKAHPYPPDMAELVRQEKPEPEWIDRVKEFEVPCMIIHLYGGSLDEPNFLTVSEVIRKFYPAAECAFCRRKGTDECYGVRFVGGEKVEVCGGEN